MSPTCLASWTWFSLISKSKFPAFSSLSILSFHFPCIILIKIILMKSKHLYFSNINITETLFSASMFFIFDLLAIKFQIYCFSSVCVVYNIFKFYVFSLLCLEFSPFSVFSLWSWNPVTFVQGQKWNFLFLWKDLRDIQSECSWNYACLNCNIY